MQACNRNANVGGFLPVKVTHRKVAGPRWCGAGDSTGAAPLPGLPLPAAPGLKVKINSRLRFSFSSSPVSPLLLWVAAHVLSLLFSAPQAGCVLGLRRPPGTAAPGGVGAGARYPEQRFVCGHPPRPSSKTFPFLSVVPTCRLITPAQPAFPLAAATVGAGRPPLREPACCGLLSPAPGLLAGFVGPCGARRGAASPRGVRR